ncbi:type IV pili twitching motility protein PilT [Candidatus Parcubacteria bacterium]|jgi:twitching motility protein PilT|nr:MAG: type IV pili twitching motility protein PilT [Candidatus Parcubacteria bacterium]
MLTSEQQAITRILTQATQYRASDIHLVPGNPPVLRVDGKLMQLDQEMIISTDLLKSYIGSVLSPVQLKSLESEKDIRVTISLEGKMRFRMIAMYQKGNLSLDLRFIPDVIPTLAELGLPKESENFARAPHGLVLISGPFGSGRTTAMAAMLNLINQERVCHIITIERPIEFLFAGQKSIIEQREVGVDVKTMEHALALIESEDVDVVAISELETDTDLRACVNALHSGRLILATITADSSAQAIERLVNAFPLAEQEAARKIIADALQGIVNLRLVPRVGGGRILVSEIFAPTSASRAVIRDGQFLQLANTIQTSRQEGMVSLDRSLAELVRVGDIKPEDAEAVAIDPQSLKQMINR